MGIELRILSGARGGQTEAFEKSVIAIGRHPMSDLRFDATKDLDVSTRHAEIRGVEGRYTLFDAGSTNGTFVNGERVRGSRELRDGDVLSFGARGPEASFHRQSGAPAAAVPAPQKTSPRRSAPPIIPANVARSGAPPVADRAPEPGRRPTTERVAMAVRQQTRGLKMMIAGAVIVFGALAVGVWWTGRRDALAREAQIRQLIALNEQTARDFEARIRGMNDTALTNELRRRTDSLMQQARAGAGAGKERVAAIRTDLAKHQEMQRALIAMNLPSVQQSNDPAIGLITTDVNGGQEATGFIVTSSGLFITNRHVVSDTGGRATKITVKFANSAETHRAHVVATAAGESNDLALLQIDDRGPFVPVSGIASGIDTPVGSAIATLGFPLGTDAAMEGSGSDFVAKTTFGTGVVSKVVSDRLQLDTFAGHGSSGSPVFDEHNHVIGVIWSGAIGSGGRIVYAVPSERILELLPPGVRRSVGR